jgi:hypothetical protein
MTDADLIFDQDAHSYTQGGRQFRSVTQLLEKYGMAEDFSRVPARVLAYAVARGNAVHEAGRLLALGQLDDVSVDPRIEAYVSALRDFLRETKLEVIDTETPRISPLGFGFTVDLVAWVSGRRAVLDYKTGSTLPKSSGPQLGAYKIGWTSVYPDQPIEDRYAVHLRADGTYRLKQFEDPDDETAFMDCLDADLKLDRWRRKYK